MTSEPPLSVAADEQQRRGARDFIPYLHTFRGVAIVLIIVGHVPSPRWLAYLVANGSVFFVFISGVLFDHLCDENESSWSFLKRKALRLVAPYVVASLPGMIYVASATDSWSLGYLVSTIVTGIGHANNAHWFIPFILLMFMLYPLLRRLRRHDAALLAATAVWLVIGALSFRSAGNANPLVSVIHFGGVFLAGMAFSRHRVAFEHFLTRRFRAVLVCSIGAFLLTLPFVPASSRMTFERLVQDPTIAVDFWFLGKLVLIPAVLATLKALDDSGWKLAPLGFLADTSFGLFFWHMYVIATMKYALRVMDLTPAYGPGLRFPGSVIDAGIVVMQSVVVTCVLSLCLVLARRLLGPKSVHLTGY